MKIIAIICLVISGIAAKTEKYRIMWREDPATTMVVGWVQENGSDAVVHYGPEDKGQDCSEYAKSHQVDRSTRVADMDHRFARLTGLEPASTYYFVICDDDGASPRMYFNTAPNDAETPFTIIAGGDSRNNENIRQQSNVLVSKLRPLFVMFGGDMTDKSSDSQWAEWLDDWQYTMSEDGRMYPVLAARGNHEKGNEYVTDIFDTPNQDAYYSLGFANGLIRIWTLNTEISKGGNQADWLRNDLEEHKDVVWKFAQYHKPMRPHVSKKSEGNGQYQNWAEPFYDNKMNLVVECDAHTVKHTWPIVPSDDPDSDMGFKRDDEKGTVYIGEGCWGAPLRSANDEKSWTRDMAKFNSFHWIHVNGYDDVKIRTIETNGTSQVVAKAEGDDPFAIPEGLKIWSPPNGDMIQLKTLTEPPTTGLIEPKTGASGNFLTPIPGMEEYNILGSRIWPWQQNQIPLIFPSVNPDSPSPVSNPD